MSDADDTVIVEFVDEETGDTYDTIKFLAEEWELVEILADVRDVSPEEAFREAVTEYLASCKSAESAD